MKRMRFLLPLMAILLAAGAALATKTKLNKAVNVIEWEYRPTLGATDNPEAYVRLDQETPQFSCSSGNIVCKILANPDSNDQSKPDLSAGDPQNSSAYSTQFRN